MREIKSPIILFASLGDNITPPQQAFNWVADVYGSTDEIKARGQVIVGLLHKEIGHLGIFVSGRVAKKEHRQIVSVLKSIEGLPPGLYGMEILERKSADGKTEYNVQFQERRLEEVAQRLNRFRRADEKPFNAVEDIAEFNQRAYELFVRPLVQAITNEQTAKSLRTMHPLRIQHWAISDLNPWLAWLGPVAALVKANRSTVPKEAPARRFERMFSEVISASLDFYREIRDAASEALFYETYGNMVTLSVGGVGDGEQEEQGTEDGNHYMEEAVAKIGQGGYPEAVARVFALLARRGAPLSLAQLHLKRELAAKFADLLPKASPDKQRRIRGMQDLIVRHSPEEALSTLPQLLTRQADRVRLSRLLDRVMAEEGMQQLNVTPAQLEMLRRIRQVLATSTRPRARSKTKLRLMRPALAQAA